MKKSVKKRSFGVVSILLVLLILLFGIFILLISRKPTFSPINEVYLTDCGNLTQSDTIYSLQNDVSSNGTCFNVFANNITLDGNGHNISYGIVDCEWSSSLEEYASFSGVYSAVNNTVLKNLSISVGSSKNCGAKSGVFFDNNFNGRVNYANISNNDLGIYFSNSSNSVVSNVYSDDSLGIIYGRNNSFISNTFLLPISMYVALSDGVNIHSNTFIAGSSDSWINVQGTNVIISNNTVINLPIYLSGSFNSSIVYNNISGNSSLGLYGYGPGLPGIWITSSSDYHIAFNTITHLYTGIQAGGENDSDDLIENNTLMFNGYGMTFDHTGESLIQNNFLDSNDYGMWVLGGEGNTVYHNVINNSQHSGIDISGLANNISSNVILGGITGISSSGNNSDISFNIVGNHQEGIVVDSSNNLLLRSNIVFNNSFGIALSKGWYTGPDGIHAVYYDVSNNSLISNTVVNNLLGVSLWGSVGGLISYNNISSNNNGISLSEGIGNILISNTVENNSVQDISHYYSNGTIFIGNIIGSYSFSNSSFVVDEENYGEVRYLNTSLSGQGANFSSLFRFGTNSLVMKQSDLGFNGSVEITLSHLAPSGVNDRILRDGVECNSTTSVTCFVLNSSINFVTFNASVSYGNYSVLGRNYCLASCTGSSCGDDGCGGSCGICPSGQSCNSDINQCFVCDTCSSLGKQCGNLTGNCGSLSCGICPSGQSCNSTGQCICVPNCAGKSCGSDGCGGSCGTCSSSLVCNSSSQCAVCVPSCSNRTCGDNGCGGSCGTCSSGQSCSSGGQCTSSLSCVPSCSGKTCGNNGCGGTCGTCSTGQSCNSTGRCVLVSAGNNNGSLFSGGGVSVCTNQQNQSCSVGSCSGVKICNNGAWGSCVKTNSSCGVVIENPKSNTRAYMILGVGGLGLIVLVIVLLIIVLMVNRRENPIQQNY